MFKEKMQKLRRNALYVKSTLQVHKNKFIALLNADTQVTIERRLVKAMSKRIIIIPKEDEAQTLESVLELPLKVQLNLALYVLDIKDLCNVLNTVKGLSKWDKESYSTDCYDILKRKLTTSVVG